MLTVIGGGLAGLVAAIAAAERGEQVVVHEAHARLGGRATSADGPFRANLGPHVIYDDGPWWRWLDERGIAQPAGRATLGQVRFVWRGQARRFPPLHVWRVVTARREVAPVDASFREWATDRFGADVAEVLSTGAGVFTFDHDPGRLSAAFVWERLMRVIGAVPPAARYIPGGWRTLVERLAAHARWLGVEIVTGSRVDEFPDPPVIIATELRAAARLLDDETLHWESARAAFLDVALEARRGDPFIVSMLERPGWVERFTKPDPSLAPPGHSLLQAQTGLAPKEILADGIGQLEAVFDIAYPRWRERLVWRRQYELVGRTGALDLPGRTWRDRPAIDRGNGVYLVGDMVAAPGLLSEVGHASAASAVEAIIAGRRARGPARARWIPTTQELQR
jgi:glycine/D-amino acid oxidase-like deaminating enzyme